MQKRRRTRARILALQTLFTLEITQQSIDDSFNIPQVLNKNIPKDIQKYAEFLVTGVHKNIKIIDKLISKYCKHWDLERLAIVDLSILRIGIFELIYCDDIPTAVIINEAIELSKEYSTENSPGFINGILDSVNVEVRNK
jgi:N utilization substance protein B